MKRRRVAVAVTLVLLAGTGMVAAVAVGRPSVLPSSAAIASLSKLGDPSYPLALPGDQVVREHRFVHGGTCDDVRTAYRGEGAPVPSGSTLTEGLEATLLVESRYGRSAILFQDEVEAGRCLYSIERAPTVTATVPGVVVTDDFTAVTCINVIGVDLIIVTLGTDHGPYTAVLSPSDGTGWKAVVTKGLPADVVGLQSVPPGSVQATGGATFDRIAVSFSGTAPEGPVTIDARCTPSPPRPLGS